MNIAVIFAGGAGVRMNTKSRPKQFLELNGKPIIIYTLELFDNRCHRCGLFERVDPLSEENAQEV